MKKFSILFILFAIHIGSFAQVGIGTLTPAASSALDVTSTSQGFLPPRMTHAQRNAISSPALGLMIFCTDCGNLGEIQVRNLGGWSNVIGGPPSSLEIGDSYGGGKVAYILLVGDNGYISGQVHGLIAAVSDQGTGVQWGCQGTNMTGAEGITLGTGNQNTIDIVAGCSTVAIAANICYDLVMSGYNDWYLPSKDELDKLYLNKVAVGDFTNFTYWSSSEIDVEYASSQLFSFGYQFTNSKNISNRVRAVRSF